MSLQPGIYKATVRGVPDQIVMLTDAPSDDPWVSLHAVQNPGVVRWRWHQHDIVHGAHPLIILDLKGMRGVPVLSGFLREQGYDWIAAQIEEQSKPPRIPEPGWDGKVRAAAPDGLSRRDWVRFRTLDGGYDWHDNAGHSRKWSDLIDPTLIRDGVS